ncbi:hypothetical protein ACFQZ4_29285 [Catellatospora coxensis]|uniref:hypothetical protein n=1 Tax=Catellatospora coxensis TaxID=310354 RepID=UPI0019432B5C|nr:hypothetical protein [Catellatospora coxensis]
MSVTGRGGLSRRLTRGLVDQAAPGLRWAVAVVLLGVSGLFGGLDTVADPRAETVAAGTPVPGGPWEVTVHEAGVRRELGKLRLQKENDRWLYVIATVRITATESTMPPSDLLVLEGATGLVKPTPAEAALERDGSRLRLLHPEMPERIWFVWEQSGDAPVPTSLTISIEQRTYREDSLGGEWQWMDADEKGDDPPAGRVTVPVKADLTPPSASPSPGAGPSPTAGPSASARPRPSVNPKPSRSPSAGPTQ